MISPPSSTVELDQISSPIRPQLAVQSKGTSELADYEELPSPPPRSMTMSATTKPFHSVALKAVENEYVPSPENSPRFDAHRQRSHTIGMWDHNSGHDAIPMSGSNSSNHTLVGGAVGAASTQNHNPEVLYRQQQSLPQGGQPNLLHLSEDDNCSPGLKNRHLSAISMESGLSFGYDVEKDFNPSFPLENQPWYHGRISRADAEGLLHDDGDFLVRENIMVLNTHTLSLRWRGKPDHTLIGTTEVVSTSDLTRATGFKYHFDGGAFDTIPELIFNHLKYQIPIDKNQHTLITNPICRPGLGAKSGNVGGGQAPGIYMTMLSSSQFNTLHHGSLSPSTVDVPASTLPRNFGSSAKLPTAMVPKRGGTASPESKLQLGPRINFSPRHSARGTPLGDLKSYGSSGDLLDITSSAREDVDVQLRNVISPPPIGSDRERALTISHTSLGRSSITSSSSGNHVSPVVDSLSPKVSPVHKKMDSFGDYEHMESVSILNGASRLGLAQLPSSTSLDSQSSSSSGTPTVTNPTGVRSTNGDRVKYAEIRYPMNADGSRGGPLFVTDSKSVKYAEIHFPNGNAAPPPTASPHPFSVYDTVPPPRKHTTPYQSRAELLAQKMHDYATPNPSTRKREVPSHSDSSPHPFSQYPASSSLPRSGTASNYVQVTFGTPRSGTTIRSQASGAAQNDSVMYALLEKARRKKDRDSTASNDSALSTGSTHSGSPGPSSSHLSSHKSSPQVQSSGSHSHTQHKPLANVHSHIPEAKVHKNLPGYSLLVKVHTLLQSHSNEDLVYHLTRADAACFMLAPRPGEDAKVWKER